MAARLPARRRRPCDAEPRPRHAARVLLRGRRGRADARRRARLPHAPLRLDGRQPARGRDRHRRRRACAGRAATRTPTSSGRVRGAGANLGVVTSFTFRLHEVGPTVVGGLIAWPFERADEFLRAYRTLTTEGAARADGVPDDRCGRRPRRSCPPEWHGQPDLRAEPSATAATSRDADDGLAPIRALGDPVFDLLREQPYTELQSFLDATEPKGRHYYWRTEYAGRAERRAARDLSATLAGGVPDPGRARSGSCTLGGALNEHDGGRRRRRQPRRPLRLRRDRHVGARRPGRRRVTGAGCARPATRCEPFSTGGDLRQLPDRRRGRGPRPRRLRRELRPPRRDQAARTIRATSSARIATSRLRRMRLEAERRFPVPVATASTTSPTRRNWPRVLAGPRPHRAGLALERARRRDADRRAAARPRGAARDDAAPLRAAAAASSTRAPSPACRTLRHERHFDDAGGGLHYRIAVELRAARSVRPPRWCAAAIARALRQDAREPRTRCSARRYPDG